MSQAPSTYPSNNSHTATVPSPVGKFKPTTNNDDTTTVRLSVGGNGNISFQAIHSLHAWVSCITTSSMSSFLQIMTSLPNTKCHVTLASLNPLKMFADMLSQLGMLEYFHVLVLGNPLESSQAKIVVAQSCWSPQISLIAPPPAKWYVRHAIQYSSIHLCPMLCQDQPQETMVK